MASRPIKSAIIPIYVASGTQRFFMDYYMTLLSNLSM